ncbi:MAG: PD-(D/E)XK nuclease family protein [Betaproteobacteria bacterium]
MYAHFIARLESGATVITPNRRLAAAIRRTYDVHARDAGQAAWRSPDVIPWNAWLERGYREAFIAGATERLLIDAAQARMLWQRIVADTPEADSLLQIDSTAHAAEEAWTLAHAFLLWPALQSLALSAEARAFASWAKAFDKFCTRERLVDHARLTDVVADLVRQGAIALPADLVVFGFDRLAPQQQALLDDFAQQGIAVQIETSSDTRLDDDAPAPASTRRHAGVLEEIRAAAHWARAELTANPHSRIGVVVPELTQLRSGITRIFDEVLVPVALLHPERATTRPWNMSLGAPLADWPIVHAALLILELACGSLSLIRASVLLRSPFIGGADSERSSRALLDARLRKQGDPHVVLDALISHANTEGHFYTCGLLAERLSTLRNRVRSLPTAPQPISFWGPALQALLAAVQWPGERELDSREYQTFSKWKELIASLSRLEIVSPALSLRAVVRTLRGLAAEQVFQPETPDVPIQVLGALESAHIEFDAILVLGLTDEVWPRIAQPNPLLPIDLQRSRDLPRASAEWELAFARRLQSGWRRAAKRTVFSYHCAEGDRIFAASPLLAGMPLDDCAADVEAPLDFREAIRRSSALESVADWNGSALAEGVAFFGGARLLQDQAACPFRAFAVHRLGARALEHPHEGLDPRDRGVLLHGALANLWTELRTQANLLGAEYDALNELIEASVDRAIAKMRRNRTSTFQSRFLALERERLTALLLEWLELERQRGPFEVIACEEARVVNVGGLALNLRLDRIDRVAGGGEFLLDYKTGEVRLKMWMGERPDEPQLPLYSIAREATPQAVGFARVCRGESYFVGLAAQRGIAEKGIAEDVRELPHRSWPLHLDWTSLLTDWRRILEQLATGFRSGVAVVDPKYPSKTCDFCELATLCRVSEVVDRGAPTRSDGAPE